MTKTKQKRNIFVCKLIGNDQLNVLSVHSKTNTFMDYVDAVAFSSYQSANKSPNNTRGQRRRTTEHTHAIEQTLLTAQFA